MSSRTPNAGSSRIARRGKSASRGSGSVASIARRGETQAAGTFAALGDRTRLSLLVRLGRGGPCSISQLTHGSQLTRQAITKHLRVLEQARIVRCVRSGRHSLFALDPQPVLDLRAYLDRVSEEWDNALARLKAFVED